MRLREILGSRFEGNQDSAHYRRDTNGVSEVGSEYCGFASKSKYRKMEEMSTDEPFELVILAVGEFHLARGGDRLWQTNLKP